MSDLVRNPKDLFSPIAAHIVTSLEHVGNAMSTKSLALLSSQKNPDESSSNVDNLSIHFTSYFFFQ